jgi:hypothetical protein
MRKSSLWGSLLQTNTPRRAGKPLRKSEIVETRRERLERLLELLRVEEGTPRFLKISLRGDFGVKETCLPDDYWALLVSGIERALEGKHDPFGLNRPGRPQRFSRDEVFKAMCDVLRAEKGGMLRMAAIDAAAKKWGMKAVTLRKAMADEKTIQYARLAIEESPESRDSDG